MGKTISVLVSSGFFLFFWGGGSLHVLGFRGVSWYFQRSYGVSYFIFVMYAHTAILWEILAQGLIGLNLSAIGRGGGSPCLRGVQLVCFN